MLNIKKAFFGNRIEQLGFDDLCTEKLRLERVERQILNELRKLEEIKRRDFEKGFDASPAEKKTLARKITLSDQRIKLKTAQMDKASEALSAVEQIIFIKENTRKFEDSEFLSAMSRTTQSEMDSFLSKVSLKEAIETGKIDKVRLAMEEEFGMIPDHESDPQTVQLLSIWDKGDEARIDEEFEKWSSKDDQDDVGSTIAMKA